MKRDKYSVHIEANSYEVELTIEMNSSVIDEEFMKKWAEYYYSYDDLYDYIEHIAIAIVEDRHHNFIEGFGPVEYVGKPFETDERKYSLKLWNHKGETIDTITIIVENKWEYGERDRDVSITKIEEEEEDEVSS